MVIEKNTVVTLHYRLQKDDADGKLIEETYGKRPLTFLYGVERMIPRFEEELLGLKRGDDFAFTVKMQNAYGAYHDNMVVTLPVSSFMVNGKLAKNLLVVGKRVPMQDENGNQLEGIVQEVREDDEEVVVDFNHPHAGMDLYFCGRVQNVRKASPEELSNHQAQPLGRRQAQR